MTLAYYGCVFIIGIWSWAKFGVDSMSFAAPATQVDTACVLTLFDRYQQVITGAEKGKKPHGFEFTLSFQLLNLY